VKELLTLNSFESLQEVKNKKPQPIQIKKYLDRVI